jgi:hypothetical protein
LTRKDVENARQSVKACSFRSAGAKSATAIQSRYPWNRLWRRARRCHSVRREQLSLALSVEARC